MLSVLLTFCVNEMLQISAEKGKTFCVFKVGRIILVSAPPPLFCQKIKFLDFLMVSIGCAFMILQHTHNDHDRAL